jgi:hypothetical protein
MVDDVFGKRREAQEHKSFGGIEMICQATVQLASMNPAPYNVNHVDRKAVFVFDAGRKIYELVDPEGMRWVVQTRTLGVGSPTGTAPGSTRCRWPSMRSTTCR